MGMEYGLISGDMNVVHTSWLACKLFGIKKPFIQGLCIANYAIYKLGKREKGDLKNFKIQYRESTKLRAFRSQRLVFGRILI